MTRSIRTASTIAGTWVQLLGILVLVGGLRLSAKGRLSVTAERDETGQEAVAGEGARETQRETFRTAYEELVERIATKDGPPTEPEMEEMFRLGREVSTPSFTSRFEIERELNTSTYRDALDKATETVGRALRPPELHLERR